MQKSNSDISKYSTTRLLQIRKAEAGLDSDLDREAQHWLYKTWRDGRDLQPLIRLLTSELTNERIQGAFYLVESVPRDRQLTNVAAALADDPLPYCRKAFVGYMTNAGVFGETIAIGLAKCLLDANLYVRLEAINWAVYTTDDRFDDFSRRVSGDSRGLHIARRLRQGESVEDLRQSMPEAGRFTFDYLQLFEKRLKRYVERRKSSIRANAADVSTGYDQFDIGAAGEVYDNLGMLKGDLPLSLPEHVTDAQLDEIIDRTKESTRQRKLDQKSLDQSNAK